jgi:hypothetical protein
MTKKLQKQHKTIDFNAKNLWANKKARYKTELFINN